MKKKITIIFTLFFISCSDKELSNLSELVSLSFFVIPENAGSILYNGNESVEIGTNIKLEAVSNPPYEFVRWSGDIEGTNNPIDITANSNLNVVAEFQEPNITPLDSDNDGVPDDKDLCPNSEENSYVNVDGCPVLNEFDQSYTQVWGDEFNYDGKPDPELWHHQVLPPNPNGGWWNGELQHYTEDIKNSYVDNGTLKIESIKENYVVNGVGRDYTSARLLSKFVFEYGRVDVRAKLPQSEGTWPAIWTLGANINELGNYHKSQYGSVGWPACGEIDIMEQNGWDKKQLYGTFHWATPTGDYASYGLTTNINSSSEFHIYSMEWTKEEIKIMVDNTAYVVMSNNDAIPFDNLHYLLLNIAMGGNLGGEIKTNFTSDIMELDYVRVFQKQ
tara:strand:- start:370 stop:1536 length:1167 start_codon:yes stop_codon:yes gene_type:complete